MSKTRSRRADFSYFVPIQVRWGDMDALGHVNNSVYFTYAETGRLEFLSEVTEGQVFKNNAGPILARISCDFVEQLRHPVDIECGIGVARIGRSSIVMPCPIFVRGQDEAAADIEAVIVWFDYDQQASAPVPDAVRKKLAAYQLKG